MSLASHMNAECRYDDADALMYAAYESKNKPAAAMAHYLTLAREREDWFGVVERAQRLRLQLPNNPAGYLKGIEAHRVLKQFEHARNLLDEAIKRFSGGALLLREEALLAEARGDWEVVDARMATLRDIMPADANNWIQSATFLISSGRYEAADLLLERAMAHFARNPQVSALHARVAQHKHQWHEADRRWGTLVTAFPDDADIALGHALIWSSCQANMRNCIRDTRYSQTTRFTDIAADYRSGCARLGFLCHG